MTETVTRPFGPLDFQLVLLRRMADHQPGLVEDARHELGASIADMREANKRWQAMLRSSRSRGALARYRSVLGAPESVARAGSAIWSARRSCGRSRSGPGCASRCWRGPAGRCGTSGWSGRRAYRAPTCASEADLRPWSCTVDEAARAFAPARPMEGSAPTRRQLALTLPGGEERVAEFTWGLLQRLLP